MKRIIAPLLLALALAIAAPPADAKDTTTPGCISHREFLDMERGTMSQVEARNGVTGLGTVIVWQNGGAHVVKSYPWCNHPPMDSIQVSYDRNLAGQYMANYVIEFDMGN